MPTHVSSGQTTIVTSGIVSSGLIVDPGGDVQVWSGGLANSTVVSSGVPGIGAVSVFSGGSATNTTLSGGFLFVYGTASNTILLSSGSMDVDSGGNSFATTVNSAGRLFVFTGSDSGSIVLSGGQLLASSGGVLIGETISNSGLLDLMGGTASNLTVLSGAILELSGGAVLAGTTTISNGATVIAQNGYTLVNKTVTSGGIKYNVASGGTAIVPDRPQPCGAHAAARGDLAGIAVGAERERDEVVDMPDHEFLRLGRRGGRFVDGADVARQQPERADIGPDGLQQAGIEVGDQRLQPGAGQAKAQETRRPHGRDHRIYRCQHRLAGSQCHLLAALADGAAAFEREVEDEILAAAMLGAVERPAIGKRRGGHAKIRQAVKLDVELERGALLRFQIGPEDGPGIHLVDDLPPVPHRKVFGR